MAAEVAVRQQLRTCAVVVLFACALAWASIQVAQGQAVPAAPNIILVLVDDVGYGDIGSFGVPDAKTPNIDRLGREGVRLTDFYANGSNCSPTRTGSTSAARRTIT